MPVIDADGCPIHVEVEGPERAPVLMLSNSLGTTLAMWDGQVKPFTQHFRLVRYDRRGHGKSGVPKGPYTMERLGRDVLAVLDGLGIKKINWCGLSMGGMVGQWLGANAPERVERMVLTNTSSFFPDKAGWNDRLKLVEEKGIAAFAAPNMARWFTAGFLQRAPQAVAPIQAMFAATPLEGYLACGAAVRDMDHRALLPKIARADAGDRRPARRRHAARGERIHRQEHSRRGVHDARRRAHVQRRATGRLHRRGAELPHPSLRQVAALSAPLLPRAKRVWERSGVGDSRSYMC